MPLREADEEHLVHALEAIFRINVHQVRLLQVLLKLLDSRDNFALEALLRRHENQVVIIGIGCKFLALRLEHRLL